MFFDRVGELEEMEKRFASKRAELVVVYGRRRVGKTELLQEMLKRHAGIFLLGRQQSEKEQLAIASSKIALFFHDEVLEKNPFQNWDALFTYFKSKENAVLVFDEFPYFVQSSPALPSILQDYWDQYFSKSSINLVLCGSSLSMMEKLFGFKSPLYGRRTSQMLVKPFDFFNARSFFPSSLPTPSQVECYAVLGGTPAYLKEFDYSESMLENIGKKILAKNSWMYNDVLFVLREELNEPRLYFAILTAIAKGDTSAGRIVNTTGLGKGVVSKYLSVLQDLDIVERCVPVTEQHPHKSRQGSYRLKDNYFKFWFKFVYPHADDLERGQTTTTLNDVKQNLNAFTGACFERIAEKWSQKHYANCLVGPWWDKREEIDVVCLDHGQKHAVAFEVKWSTLDEKQATQTLSKLREKTKLLNLNDYVIETGLIAKEIKNKQATRNKHELAFDLKDIINA